MHFLNGKRTLVIAAAFVAALFAVFGLAIANDITYASIARAPDPLLAAIDNSIKAVSPAATVPPGCELEWSLVANPATGSLTDVSIVNAAEVWAVGFSNALRWTSGQWTVYNLATVLPTPLSVSGIAPNDVWAVGNDDVAHFDGTAWSTVPYPTATSLSPFPSTTPSAIPNRSTALFNAVEGRSQNDVWAVGGYGGDYGSSCVTYKFCPALIMHWNGTTWENPLASVPSSGPIGGKPDGASIHFSYLDDVAFTSPTETWLVGANYNFNSAPQYSPLAFRCAGMSCTSVAIPSEGTWTYLKSVAGVAPDDVWVVGTSSISSFIAHWDGTAWSIIPHPNAGDLRSVTAIATDDVWAVSPTTVLHWDGTSWTQVAAPSGGFSVDSRGANNVWAVGTTVMHYPDMPLFTDVNSDDTYYRYIQDLACRNILSGYSDGTFRPGNSVTRGQQAKIVSNAAGFIEPVSGQAFEDVVPGSTFYDFVQRLATRGYISGYPCGGSGEPCGAGNLPYFRPSAPVTRGQISKLVSSAAGFNDPAGTQIFEDVVPSSTFYDYVQRLASRQIMAGYPCGGPVEPCGVGNLPYFRPGNNATRGQTSKIVANTFLP